MTSNEPGAYCRKVHNCDYYLLKSIPGIRGILPAAILAELGDIRRFDNERQFVNYIGLVPVIHQSSETDNQMGVTPKCKALLRTYLIEAA
jgi:transposase